MKAGPAGLSWRSMPHDFAYIIPGFFTTLIGFIVLVPMFVAGVGTVVVWIGAPILGFTLLLASSFGRENRELLRRWGADVPEPGYRQTGTGVGRVIKVMADPQLWKELLHATLVAFPLRIVTFVLSITWVLAGLGGVTYFLWSVFLPPGESGLGSLLLPLATPGVEFDPYLVDSTAHFVVGALCLLLAPAVVRLCCLLDASIARIFLLSAPAPSAQQVPGNEGSSDAATASTIDPVGSPAMIPTSK